MRRFLLFVVGVVAATHATAQISAPVVGFVRDLRGALRPVQGVAGAFALGSAILTNVRAAGSSGRFTVAATDGELVLLEGAEIRWRGPADSPAVSFGFAGDGRPDWVRFENGSCASWRKEDDGYVPHATECSAGDSSPVLRIRSEIAERATAREPLGPGWIVLRSIGRLYAVRTSRDEDTVYELPEAPESEDR